MNNDIFTRFSKLAFISSIIGMCTLGICPAFGVIGITIGLVFKYKGVKLEKDNAKKIKIAAILGSVSIIMFAADVVIGLCFYGK